MFKNLRNKLQKYKIINNYRFRTFVFSICSLVLGIAYCLFNIVVACIYHSVWYGALACYYVILIILRSGVLLNGYRSSKHDNEEVKHMKRIKQYRFCGILFFLMAVFLAAMTVQLARSDITYKYSLFVLVVVSVYTLYRIIVAVCNVIIANKHDDFNVRSLRDINFATAFISCLSLQSAFLYAVYTGSYSNIINAITGGIVCVMVLIMGVVMIVRATIAIKRKL